MPEFGVHRDRNPMLGSEVQDPFDDHRGQHALVVVFDEDGVEGLLPHPGSDALEHQLGRFGSKIRVVFLVHAQEVLSTAHDAGLDRGAPV